MSSHNRALARARMRSAAILKLFDENVKPPARDASPPHKFENGGVDSAFQQFPGGDTPSSGQPRPPGN